RFRDRLAQALGGSGEIADDIVPMTHLWYLLSSREDREIRALPIPIGRLLPGGTVAAVVSLGRMP
ncbi:MAG: hypothetical protein ABIJ75_11435, partial [Actinomycetota bacterium]